MKTLKFMLAAATALGLASASQALTYDGATNFEGDQFVVGNIVDPTMDGLFSTNGIAAGDNESTIESGNAGFLEENRPRMYRGTGTSKYLKVSTGEAPLLRKVNESPAAANGIYIDTLVQFTVTPAGDAVVTNEADKLLIYLKEDGAGNTNLMVRAAKQNIVVDGFDTVETFPVQDIAVTNGVVAGQWYRLTVYAKLVEENLLVFNISLNGQPLKLEESLLDSDDLEAFPSLLGRDSQELAAVGFAGEGCVDDLAITEANPFAQAVDFTLALGTGVTSVSFTINGGAPIVGAGDTYTVYPDDAIVLGDVTYGGDYMEGTPTVSGFASTANGTNVVGTANCSITLAGTLAAAKIGDTKYADLEDALTAATAGQTVTLVQNATVSAPTTAAGTLDLNGKTLTLGAGAKEITFTGTGDKTIKGGDVMGAYAELTNTVPAGVNLTLDGVTFHASVMPNGSGNLLFVTNCNFLCDYDTSGNPFTSGSGATVHSYGVLFYGGSQFTQADIVDNWFAQGRRAAVQASFSGDLYFYGNTVDATANTVATGDGLDALYPALQIFSHGRVFIENNTFTGAYLGQPFLMYNKGGYRTTDAAVVFNGNTVDNTVNHLWGFYDVDKSGAAALVDPNLYFGSNTIGPDVDTTHCVYKKTLDGLDANGVTYSHTPATLALPTGVDTVYAWTHAAGAKDLYVNDSPADAVAVGTIVAVPGTEVTASAGYTLTDDATFKNKWTYAIENYAITYLNGDGTTFTDWAESYTAPTTYTVEDAVTLPVAENVALSVVGVQFGGWTNETGTVTGWVAGQTGAVTVYLQLDQIVAPVTALDPSVNVITVKVEAVSAEAAVADATVTPPAGSAVDAANYKTNFTITATAVDGEAGKFNVVIEGLKSDLVEAISKDAVDVFSGDTTVTVPAGLYYRITPATALPINASGAGTLSDGTGITVTKPGTTKGFLKIELRADPFPVE